jgi:transcriptional regulator with XRE-family HTH domain
MTKNQSLQNMEALTMGSDDEVTSHRTKKEPIRREGHLGKTLKEFRLKAGLTQAEVARMCSVSITQYNHYENGIYSPDYEKLIEICDCISVDPLAVISVALNRSKISREKKGIIGLPIEFFENSMMAFNKKIDAVQNELAF